MKNYIIEAIFLLCQFAFAYDQAGLIKNNQKINHFWWAMMNVPLLIIAYFVHPYSWILIISLIIERFIFFSILLNLLRHKPIWYLNPYAPNASKIDGIIYPHYKLIWGICFVAFIILQFYLC